MACRKSLETHGGEDGMMRYSPDPSVPATAGTEAPGLLFGTDCVAPADERLQNNLELFEWMVRNKEYPVFCGRNITGADCLTPEEAVFLHTKGVKIAAVFPPDSGEMLTETEGRLCAYRAVLRAAELKIPGKCAIFLDIRNDTPVSAGFLYGYASALTREGYVPAFRADTDANSAFAREFSRGTELYPELSDTCLVWATSPILPEYDSMTSSHFISPDNWNPCAPAGTESSRIAIWQYGKNCHPIGTDNGRTTTFNLDLIRNMRILIENLF